MNESWWKKVLSAGGEASFGRAGTAFVVCALVVWGSYQVFSGKGIPDVPTAWVSIIGLLWGVGKITEGVVAVKGGANAQPVE